MANKVVIGNIITIITFILTIYANTIINRRKHLKMWVFINSIDCVAWAILGSWQGSIACLYPVVRHSYIMWKYKEEKIVVDKWVSIITCLPYIIIGLIELRNGISWRVLAGVVNFINSMTFMIYRDDTRLKVEGCCDVYYLIYGLYYRNYGEVIRNVVEMLQFGINIIRLKINGEKKYYKDKRNVVND